LNVCVGGGGSHAEKKNVVAIGLSDC